MGNMTKIIYDMRLPDKVIIRVGDTLLVGTKGVETDERVCTEKRKQMELHG
jgi:hypothetical protein